MFAWKGKITLSHFGDKFDQKYEIKPTWSGHAIHKYYRILEKVCIFPFFSEYLHGIRNVDCISGQSKLCTKTKLNCEHGFCFVRSRTR